MTIKQTLFTVLILAFCAEMGKAELHKQQIILVVPILSRASTSCKNDAQKLAYWRPKRHQQFSLT